LTFRQRDIRKLKAAEVAEYSLLDRTRNEGILKKKIKDPI
jgi:hypothetical protein